MTQSLATILCVVVLLVLFAAYARGAEPHFARWLERRSRRLPKVPLVRRPVERPGMFLVTLQPSAQDKIESLPPFYQPNLRNLGRSLNFWASGVSEARTFALAYWRNLGRLALDDADLVIQAT